jgi:hypothetical protein
MCFSFLYPTILHFNNSKKLDLPTFYTRHIILYIIIKKSLYIYLNYSVKIEMLFWAERFLSVP